MGEITYEDVYRQLRELPQDALGDVAKYVEFLRFKLGKSKTDKAARPLRIVNLEGLLEGYDFSPEFIAEARKEMWGNFPRDIELDALGQEP